MQKRPMSEVQKRGIRDFKRNFGVSDNFLRSYLRLAGSSPEEIEDTLRTRPEEEMRKGAFKNPRNQSIAELWLIDKRLDRFLAILQTLFIGLFSLWQKYPENNLLFPLFSLVAFVCFFGIPVVYIMKLTKGIALNRKLGELAKQNKIPSWIPSRRKLLILLWFIFANPAFWIFFTLMLASISFYVPFFYLLLSLIPWTLLEFMHAKERQYLKLFLATP